MTLLKKWITYMTLFITVGSIFNIYDIRVNLNKKDNGYDSIYAAEGKKNSNKDKNNLDLLNKESFDLKEQLNSVFSQMIEDKYI